MNSQTGKYFILIGAIVIIAGVIIYFFPTGLTGSADFRVTSGLKSKNSDFIFP